MKSERKQAQDLDDPIKMKAIILSLRMYLDFGYSDILKKKDILEIAYGEDQMTQTLLEVAKMK